MAALLGFALFTPLWCGPFCVGDSLLICWWIFSSLYHSLPLVMNEKKWFAPIWDKLIVVFWNRGSVEVSSFLKHCYFREATYCVLLGADISAICWLEQAGKRGECSVLPAVAHTFPFITLRNVSAQPSTLLVCIDFLQGLGRPSNCSYFALILCFGLSSVPVFTFFFFPFFLIILFLKSNSIFFIF